MSVQVAARGAIVVLVTVHGPEEKTLIDASSR